VSVSRESTGPQQGERPEELSLEATLEQKLRVHWSRKRQSKGRASADGYNPYDADAAVKSGDARRKPKDLRKLSEWIRTQRQVNALKKQEKL
jgi:hypothetical protein